MLSTFKSWWRRSQLKEKGKHSRERKRELASNGGEAPANAVGTSAGLGPKGWSPRRRARAAPPAVSQGGGGHNIPPAEGEQVYVR